jgi:hypothetical protein
MSDPFHAMTSGLQSPASDAFAITPDDATDLPLATRALNVAQSGYVQLETVSGSLATLYIAAGVAFPVRARRVLASGTDATGIVGLL